MGKQGMVGPRVMTEEPGFQAEPGVGEWRHRGEHPPGCFLVHFNLTFQHPQPESFHPRWVRLLGDSGPLIPHSHKNLHRGIHSASVHNSRNLETTQVFSN